MPEEIEEQVEDTSSYDDVLDEDSPPAAPPSGGEPPESPPPEQVRADPPPVPQETPEQYLSRYKQARENALKEISSRISFTEEERLALQTEPEKVLPMLAARMQVEAFEGVLHTVLSMVPQIVQRQVAAFRAATEYENAFYSQFPELRGHSDTVRRVAVMYRQANPTAPPEQAIREIGRMATSLVQSSNVAPQKPPRQRARPFVPAAPSGVPAQGSKQTTSNPFAQFIQELEEMDRRDY